MGPLLAAAAAAAARMRECRGAAAHTSGSVIIGAYAPPAPVCSQLPPLAAAAARLAATAARFARAASRILTLTSIASRRGPCGCCAASAQHNARHTPFVRHMEFCTK